MSLDKHIHSVTQHPSKIGNVTRKCFGEQIPGQTCRIPVWRGLGSTPGSGVYRLPEGPRGGWWGGAGLRSESETPTGTRAWALPLPPRVPCCPLPRPPSVRPGTGGRVTSPEQVHVAMT